MAAESNGPQPISSALADAAAEMESAESAAPETTEEAPETGAAEPAEEAAETPTEEGAAEEPDEESPEGFGLSPDEEAGIRANPALAKLRKSLLRSYTQNQQRHAEAVRLAEIIRSDPDAFLQAASRMRGYDLLKMGEKAAAAPAPEAAAEAAMVAAAEKLERVFGPEAGPIVRGVFEEMTRSMIGSAMAPIMTTLERQQGVQLASQMSAEEASFKARTQGITPEIEREMVALGQSGKVMPGPEMSPREYLDLLYEMVMARRSRTKASADLADRVKRAKEDAEPVRGVSSRGAITKVSRIQPGKHSLSEALQIAAEELGER
jgi:hypothetical protein